MPWSHVIKMEVIKKLLLISFCLNSGLTFNILGLFPYQGKSHFFVFQPYLQELANRGHNLTVVSYFPQKKPINNYHDISLAGKAKIFEAILPLERSYQSIVSISSMLVGTGPKNCKTLLADEKVQDLWKSQVKFDLVLVEQFNSDCGLGLAYKLGAPVVGLTSHTLMPWSYSRFGIPYSPAYDCFMFLEGGTKPTLYQRIERRIFKIYANLLFKYHSQLVDQNTLAEYFDDVPPLEELGKNMKFMLVYTNFVLGGSLLMPANVIEVGGYHVAKPKELPENLKKFIEESEHGVIYISFGSMLRAISLPREKLDAIIGALSELPQRVIWKWEEDTLPGNPKNIYLSKWLPQNDLLAHPNVVAFYSHCGLLGTTEAIHYGVPVIGMPIFGDQPSNAASIEESGLGVQIYLNELSKENLLKKLQTVLDPKFRNKVKQLSKAWHDRPMSAMDSAIYWTEYAARTANISFRSPAAHVPYYQDLGLDVLAVLAALILAPFFVLKAIVKRKPLQTKIKVKKN